MATPNTHKVWNYMRLGIYNLTHSGNHENFCDIHFFGGISKFTRHGRFSGPDMALGDVKKPPTEKDVDLWLRKREVDATHDIANGGKAMLFRDGKTHETNCYLFGPLQYLGAGYGSLVLSLGGWQPPTWKYVEDKDRGMLPELDFPITHGFNTCRMYTSGFALTDHFDEFYSASAYGALLLRMVHKVKTEVRLPRGVKRRVWRIEDGRNRVSWNEMMAAHG